MAVHIIKRKDLRRPSGFSVDLQSGETHKIVVSRQQAVFIEFADTLFRNNSGVLLPSETGPSADGIPHPGLDVVAACLSYAKTHPGKKILITAHTDTVGSDEANVRLSMIRGQTVHGMLTGQRDAFAEACYGPHLTGEQRYPPTNDKKGVLWDDYADVLQWLADTYGWPCTVKKKGTLWGATCEFQRQYNAAGHAGNPTAVDLQITGKFDKPTWAAVYDCYDQKLAENLAIDGPGLAALRASLEFVRADRPYVGCGEFKPIEQVGRNNYKSQTNRRVEVLFFDPGEEPAVPCLNDACVPDACMLYDDHWFRRRPVPVGAVAWLATWEKPSESVHMGEIRNMVLTAPDLSDGEVVTFDVYANGQLPVGAQVQATVVGGVASAPWKTWFDEKIVSAKVTLGAGQAFPSVAFTFVATATGEATRSPALAYSDEIRAQLSWRVQGESGPEEEPMVDTPYTLHSPFGTREGKTAKNAGSDGWVIEEALPPGGATIVLSNGSIAITNT